MDTKNNKKGRLIYLLKYLYENTDEQNPVSTNELIAYFADRDISVNRKTIKDDIDVLSDAGFDIVTIKSSFNSFFWGERQFQIPELKLLIDAVSSSKFITRDKSEELIKKLTDLNYELLKNRYHLGEAKEAALENMEEIALKRGFILSGNRIDYERVARTVLDEFRAGILGRVTLEYPDF
ncbi:MAG: hypothetical protein EOM00_13960 [Clostridia bacterium]|nr:hypothetical protein [Clostridia bacterium]